MSKNVLVGIDGLAREANNLWVGIDGKARRVKSAYVGVNGTAKKFWPRIIYVWNRYNVNYTLERGMVDSKSDFNTGLEDYIKVYTPTSLTGGVWVYYLDNYNQSTGVCTLREDAYLKKGYQQGMLEDFEYCFFQQQLSSLEISYNQATFWSTPASRVRMEYVETIRDNESMYNTEGPGIYVTDITYLYKKWIEPGRNVYIDQVFSEESNTYPQNGKQGNYWYVYQGTQG